jgi:hypothetical protein
MPEGASLLKIEFGRKLMRAAIEIVKEDPWTFDSLFPSMTPEERQTLDEAKAKLTGTQWDYWSEAR